MSCLFHRDIESHLYLATKIMCATGDLSYERLETMEMPSINKLQTLDQSVS